MYVHHPESIRLQYRRYRGWCIGKGYRWLPYRRWFCEMSVACLLAGCTTTSPGHPRQMTGPIFMPSCLFACHVTVTASEAGVPAALQVDKSAPAP